MTWCCSSNCTNSKKKFPALSFFTFPIDKERCWQWVLNTQREDLQRKEHAALHKNYTLCANHFEDREFMNPKLKNRLVWDAVPTLFNVSKHGSADKPTKINNKMPPTIDRIDENTYHGNVPMGKVSDLPISTCSLKHPYGSDPSSSAYMVRRRSYMLRHEYGKGVHVRSSAPPLRQTYSNSSSSIPPLQPLSDHNLVPNISISGKASQKSLADGPCDNEINPYPSLSMTTLDAQIPVTEHMWSISDNVENELVGPLLTDHCYYSNNEKLTSGSDTQPQQSSILQSHQDSLLGVSDDVDLEPVINEPIPSYKSKQDLKYSEQLASYRRTIRNQRCRIHRLNKKVACLQKQLGQAKTITHLPVNDIIKLSGEYLSGSPLSFFAAQLRASVTSKRTGRRWMDADKQLSLSLYQQSPQIYKFMSEHFALPHVRVLQRFCKEVSTKELPSSDMAENVIDTEREKAENNLVLALGE